MRHFHVLHIVILFFFLSGLPKRSSAQPAPANDLCQDATDISSDIGSNVCGDDGSATNDPDDGDVTSCWDDDSEVWYSFSGVYTIDVAITSWCGTTYEPNVTIYSGSCGGGLTELGCGDWNDNDGQVDAGGLDPAQTYYLSVDNDGTNCTGSFCFDISEFQPPPNDTCEGAIDISSSFGGIYCAEDTSASNDPDDGDVTSCDDEDSEVWHSFTGKEAVEIAIDNWCDGAGDYSEPNISLYSGSCGGGLTEMVCDDLGDTIQASGLDPSKTYYLSIDNDATDCSEGDACFYINEFHPPPNDTCEGAIDISSDINSTVCGADTSATNDPDDGDVTSCDDDDSEVWYSFTGEDGVDLEVSSWCGTTYEPNISIYEGSCGGGLTELACDASGDPLQLGNLDPSQTYYISVGNDETDCSGGDFCFDFDELTPPPNDTCEGAIDISSSIGGIYCAEDTTATNDPDDGDVTSCDDEDSEVWHSFTGQESIEIAIDNWCDGAGDYSEPNITLYSGSCGGGLTEIMCDDLGDTLRTSGLDPSETYYISVDNDETDCLEGDACFHIDDFQPPPNDTCEGAIDVSSSIGGTVCTEDTMATNDPDDGDVTSCDDEDSEVWMSFTGQDKIEVAVDDWCGPDGDYSEPNITVYSGSCGGNLTEIMCDDMGDTLRASGLDPSKTYYISVDNDPTDCEEGEICVHLDDDFNVPPNDTCEGALDVSSSIGGVYCTEDTSATSDGDDGGQTSCDSEGSEVWMSFTGQDKIEVAVDDWCGSDGDYSEPNITLYSGSCGGNLTEIMCDDMGDTLRTGGLDPTKTYYISVDNDHTDCEEGEVCIHLDDDFNPPPNDTCEGAIDISSDFGGVYCGSDTSATNDPDDGNVTSCDDEDSEVWYSFTGQTSVEIQLDSWCGSTYEPNVSLYEGTCGGGLNQLACEDLGDPLMVGSLDSNQTYYLSVDNDASACSGGEVCLDLGNIDSTGECLSSAQGIDQCGTSFTLNTGDMSECGYECCGSTRHSNYDNACGASTCGACSDGCDMDGSTENNAFWSFTPSESCEYEVTFDVYNCGGSGIQYAIYEYVSGEFTNYFAHDGSSSGSPATITETFAATSGNDVVIMVDGYAGDDCDVDVTLNEVDCSGCTVLPLELLSFEGEAEAEGNLLRWRTSSEDGVDRFVLERSPDGADFDPVLEKEAEGMSSTSNSYRALDEEPPEGKSYYRLREVDEDGSSSRSEPVLIDRADRDIDGLRIQKVYPNPTDQDRIHLELASGKGGEMEFRVFDRMGKELIRSVKRIEEGQSTLPMNLEELPKGFYTIRLQDPDEPARGASAHFVVE